MNNMKFTEMMQNMLKDHGSDIQFICKEIKLTDDCFFAENVLEIPLAEDNLADGNYMFMPTDAYLKRENEVYFQQVFFRPGYSIAVDQCFWLYITLEHTVFTEQDSLVAKILGIRIRKR